MKTKLPLERWGVFSLPSLLLDQGTLRWEGMTTEIPKGIAIPLLLLESQMAKKEAMGLRSWIYGSFVVSWGSRARQVLSIIHMIATGTELLVCTRLWSSKSMQRGLTCRLDHVTKLLKTFQHLFLLFPEENSEPYPYSPRCGTI